MDDSFLVNNLSHDITELGGLYRGSLVKQWVEEVTETVAAMVLITRFSYCGVSVAQIQDEPINHRLPSQQ